MLHIMLKDVEACYGLSPAASNKPLLHSRQPDVEALPVAAAGAAVALVAAVTVAGMKTTLS